MNVRIASILALLSLAAMGNAFSQDSTQAGNPPDAPPPQDASPAEKPVIIDSSGVSPYEKGDGMLSLGAGATFDVALFGFADAAFLPTNIWPGIDFSLSYMHFLDGRFAIGGEAGGSFNSTLGERSFFMAPVLFKAAWMFVRMPFEIMPYAGAGISFTSVGLMRHIDPTLKLGTTLFWRANQDASYGIDFNALFIGQFSAKYPANNCLSLFLETGLVAVYHL